MPMTKAKSAEQKAASTTIKEERARLAAMAMRDYEAERRATLAKTERLRALRLARDAETSARSGVGGRSKGTR
jgi:hypothetical protein